MHVKFGENTTFLFTWFGTIFDPFYKFFLWQIAEFPYDIPLGLQICGTLYRHCCQQSKNNSTRVHFAEEPSKQLKPSQRHTAVNCQQEAACSQHAHVLPREQHSLCEGPDKAWITPQKSSTNSDRENQRILPPALTLVGRDLRSSSLNSLSLLHQARPGQAHGKMRMGPLV